MPPENRRGSVERGQFGAASAAVGGRGGHGSRAGGAGGVPAGAQRGDRHLDQRHCPAHVRGRLSGEWVTLLGVCV